MGDEYPAVSSQELSPAEAEERAKTVFALEQRIKQGLAQGRAAMWDVAQRLHAFDEQSGWTALGYEKLADWLADPEISMMRRTYYRLISAYREVVVIRQANFEDVKQLDYSKVDIVLPAVKSGSVKLQDALDDVKTLGATDLRGRYYSRPDPAPSITAVPSAPVSGTSLDVIDYTPPPVNDGNDTPVFASDVVVAPAPAPEPEPEPPEPESAPVDYESILTMKDLLLLNTALIGWEDPRRRETCPRGDSRAVRRKIKALMKRLAVA